ncbi:MAG: hypothetical protein M3Q92_09670 [Actinomycetota bacterium]|nr:hypothetical protein [Actinomycetota bacterium]
MSEVPETPPTSFVIVELARPPRQAFQFAEQADALRLAERTRTPPSGRNALVEGHFRAVGGA